ncbi:Paxillin-like protein 1 [Fulvia fulva]|nr:Paxillin-like protein 1 [Fulvia fulva]WPV10300.1 Paxillin-like protein 1 [Fulvia fulva]WPV24757.1 Paxillin-like protein 1 [Fulvia fulva]
MSLAAALAQDGVRPVSFLPSIKCSDCGNEIQIDEMGDHVCPPTTTRPPVLTSAINPFTLRQMNARGQQVAAMPSPQSHSSIPQINGTAFDTAAHAPEQRSQRMPLPRINSDAANKPFLAPRPAPFEPPLSPTLSSRSGSSSVGRSGYQRSNTSPASRPFDFRPPSPELSANLDCAFPPFPTSAGTERRPSTSHSNHGRKTPTGSDRAPSRGASRLDHVMSAEPESFDMPPKSPYIGGTNANVLQRLDTLRSGPFGASRRKASGDVRTDGTRRPSLAPLEDNTPVTATPYESSSPHANAINTEKLVNGSHSQKKAAPPRPARPTEEVLRLSFLDQMSEEPTRIMAPSLGPDNGQDSDGFRSQTYPPQMSAGEHETQGSALARMHSEPQLHAVGRRPSLGGIANCEHLDSSRAGGRDVPPLPQAVLSYRENMMHTPTGSSSSVTSSTNSRTNTNSSGISPDGSVASSLDMFSPPASEPRRYGEDDRMHVRALNVSRSPEKPPHSHQRTIQQSPARNFARPSLDQDVPRYRTDASLTPLESPMDPALSTMQNRSGHAFEPWGSERVERGPSPSDLSMPKLQDYVDLTKSSTEYVQRSRSASNRSLTLRTLEPQNTPPSALQPPPTPQEPPARRQHGRRPTNAKAMCRGCGFMIEGKSVKAADGRLTGRWHKACFVCRSCQQPFMTADFYVMNNEPYCEQHYHEKNGSLCHGCHRGIEGQYLETSSSTRFGSIDKKFHPRCFTCCECRMVLAQDYFEITSKVYCERHALAAMRAQARLGAGLQPPDRRNLIAERRTTRLINPMMA